MRMSINPEKFQESITRELEVVKDRVRNLIGSAHWGEEGRYKEAVLMNVIRRFLPSDVSVGTGFVAKSENRHVWWEEVAVSKQIDIIVYDNRIPVLFSEGDFIITTQRNVRAIVEVKTKANNSQLRGILRTSIENARLMENSIFNGIFVFEYDNRNSIASLKSILEELGENGKYVNHVSLGPYIFVKHWMRQPPVNPNGCDSDFYGIYDFGRNNRREAKKLSFSYFISNLVYSISGRQLSDRLWLLFPAEGGKEKYRVGTACLGSSHVLHQ
jgi:hypothetical protein